MFLKKVLGFTSSKTREKLIDNSIFSAYNMLYNKMDVTEFCYKNESAFKAASKMASIKHMNILRVIKVDSKNKRILTEQIFPFRSVFSASDKIFNKHCAYTLANIICFLHKDHRLGHNNISFDALFVTLNLNIVIGSFERCKDNIFQKDLEDFKVFLKQTFLPARTVQSIFESRDWFCEFFDEMEAFILEFSILELVKKRNMIEKINTNKKVLNFFFRERVSKWITSELEKLRLKNRKESLETYKLKEEMLNLILELSPSKDTSVSSLFKILDPFTRSLLLRSPDVFSVQKLDSKAVEALLLGVKCRDSHIQVLTINFVSYYYKNMTEKEKVSFIKACKLLNDRDLLKRVCKVIDQNREYSSKVTAEIYKFIEAFLPIEDLRLEVLPLIVRYYESFNYTCICSCIGPFMFELTRSKETQDIAFIIIEKLLEHLKKEKSKIIDKSWKLSSIKTLFKEKRSKPQAENEKNDKNVKSSKTDMESTENLEDDWCDNW